MNLLVKCPRCGQPHDINSNYCLNCGYNIASEQSATNAATDDSTQMVNDSDSTQMVDGTQVFDETLPVGQNDADSPTLHISNYNDTVNTAADNVPASAYGHSFYPAEPKRRSVWVWLAPLLVILAIGAGVGAYFLFNKGSVTLSHAADEDDATELAIEIENVTEPGEGTEVIEVTSPDDMETPDLSFMELKGHVKSVTANGFTTEFDALGNMQLSAENRCERDGMGRIVKLIYNDMWTREFIYQGNSLHPYKSYVVEDASPICVATYNGRQLVRETYTMIDDSEMTLIYSDYEYDSHGNWISRKITRKANDNYSEDYEQIQTRSIVYYDN